jgi:hypothetical protein
MDRREFLHAASGVSACLSVGNAFHQPHDETSPLLDGPRVRFEIGVEAATGAPSLVCHFADLHTQKPKSLKLRTMQSSLAPFGVRGLRNGVDFGRFTWGLPQLGFSTKKTDVEAAEAFIEANFYDVFRSAADAAVDYKHGEAWLLLRPRLVETSCTPEGRETFLKLLDQMLDDVPPEHDQGTLITLINHMNGKGIEGHVAYPWDSAARPSRKHAYYRVRKGRIAKNEQCCIV